MKSVYLVAATLLLGGPASANPVAVGSQCPGSSCPLPQQTPSGPSFLFHSDHQDSLGLDASLPTAILSNSSRTSFVASSSSAATLVPSSTAADAQTQLDFATQHAALVSLASPADPTNLLNFFGANTMNPESKRDPSHGPSATTSEPSTLLLLSFGLLLVPLVRKSRATKRALHLRLA